MDVDFSLVPGQAASSKSRIGDDERVYVGVGAGVAAGVPLLRGGKTNVDGECGVFYSNNLPLKTEKSPTVKPFGKKWTNPQHGTTSSPPW